MKRVLLCLACLFICSSGLLLAGKPNRLRKLTEQEKIQMVLANLRQAAQHGNANEFMLNFSRDYKDADTKSGDDHAKLNKNATDFLSRYKPIDDKPLLYIYDTKINIGGNIATVDCKVMLMARATVTNEKINQLMDERMTFVKSGEVWRINKTSNLNDCIGKMQSSKTRTY